MRAHRPGARATICLALLAALAVASFLAPGAGAAAHAPTTGESGGDLYLLQAEGGVLSASKLVLHGVAPGVTDFTDRPRRSAGLVGVTKFTSDWTSTFGAVAPNAALEVQGAPKDRDVALIELRKPRYDARTRTLTFTVHRLNHDADPALKEFDRRADGTAVKRFGHASLFVDSGGETLVAATIRVSVPGSSNLAIEFTGETSYSGGVYLSGIDTPPTFGTPPTSTGLIFLQGSKLTFEASGGAGMSAEVIVFVTESGGRISGTATLPANAEATISVADGPAQTLTNGKFSVNG